MKKFIVLAVALCASAQISLVSALSPYEKRAREYEESMRQSRMAEENLQIKMHQERAERRKKLEQELIDCNINIESLGVKYWNASIGSAERMQFAKEKIAAEQLRDKIKTELKSLGIFIV